MAAPLARRVGGEQGAAAVGILHHHGGDAAALGDVAAIDGPVGAAADDLVGAEMPGMALARLGMRRPGFDAAAIALQRRLDRALGDAEIAEAAFLAQALLLLQPVDELLVGAAD